MPLGPYAAFIVTSYVLVTAVVLMLIVWIAVDYRRQRLLLRELEGLSYEELSKVLAIRKGTVMSRLFHARLKMQSKLREYLGEDAPEAGSREEDEE